MKERPILFQGAMVCALLSGAKTQTRRAVKPQPFPDRLHRSVDSPSDSCIPGEHTWWSGNHTQGIYHTARCPYGQPGDRLWVREAHWWFKDECDHATGYAPPKLTAEDVEYRADGDDGRKVWRPSIHMPRWASRITLEITDVRVERLQDISEVDARAEGLVEHRKGGWHWEQPPSGIEGSNHFGYTTARDAYRALWDQINGTGASATNPWVWAVTFQATEGAKQ